MAWRTFQPSFVYHRAAATDSDRILNAEKILQYVMQAHCGVGCPQSAPGKVTADSYLTGLICCSKLG